MDSLAKNGINFTRAYSANPVCVPARTAMVTGHYPSKLGFCENTDNNNAVYTDNIVKGSIGWLLKEAGYDTVFGGKTHWAQSKKPEFFGLDLLTEDMRDGLAHDCAQYIRQHKCKMTMKGEIGNSKKPFFMLASFINPHDICYMSLDDYADTLGMERQQQNNVTERIVMKDAMRIPEEVDSEEFYTKLCPPLPNDFEVPAEELEGMQILLNGFRKYVRECWDEKKWRHFRWTYCRLNENVDHQIGIVLAALEETGLDRDTVVIFTSDHGCMDASHKMVHKGEFYENSVRVPLIISWKGVLPCGYINNKNIVSASIDLIPTICGFAGIDAPKDLPGMDLRVLFEDDESGVNCMDHVKNAKNRKYVVSENMAGRLLITNDYKYAVFHIGQRREWLIDLRNDPEEMKNLAYDPKYKKILNLHRKYMAEWVQIYGDEYAAKFIM
jgi:choline-sulfatase